MQNIFLLIGINMIRDKVKSGPVVIDLTGPDGNAFALMGYARSFSKQLGIDSDKVIGEMMSGDYENLLKVFDSYFGDFVILEK
jgi:hypothetical protein